MAAILTASRLEHLLDYAGTDLTKSDLEAPHQRLIVETDSWRYHKTRHAFENDHARDVSALSAGYGMLRFTDRQLTRRPQRVATAIAAILADRRAA
jgi:very-short-patch-repair endonuclease